MKFSPQSPSLSKVTTLLILGVSLVLSLQCILALQLDLYSDEIFYWQASTRLALAYSDLPFMSALLAGLGSGLLGNSPFAVRLPFIVLGTSFPFLVYWLARPIVQGQQAVEAAALSLSVPLLAFAGLLAVPDVPLLFFGLLAMGLFERSVRGNSNVAWIALGVIAACGFSTHYRFFPFAAAALVYLLLSSEGRQCWRTPGLWIAMAIAITGPLPIVIFNVSNDMTSLSFYFVDRHPWEFQASGLLHLFKQALLVTPPLYILLLLTLWRMVKQARKGHDTSLMLSIFASSHLLLYLLLAPWTDSNSTSIHWPLSGYLPLLVFAPQTLRDAFHWLSRRLTAVTSNRLVLSVPIIGFFGTVSVFIGVGSQAFHAQLQPLLGSNVLSTKMAGWEEFSEYTATLVEREFPASAPVIVTDNYYTAAQLEFASTSSMDVFNIDNSRALSNGRFAQYILWGKDVSALSNEAGKEALFITEDSMLTTPEKLAAVATMCSRASSLEFIEQLSQLNEAKRFSYYRSGPLLKDENENGATPCPYPSQAWIDQPLDGTRVYGETSISGWAFNEDIGIHEVAVLIDGKQIGIANYGLARPDVVEVMQVKSDPSLPHLGFDLLFDSIVYRNGVHSLAILLTNNVGETQLYGSRRIIISNP